MAIRVRVLGYFVVTCCVVCGGAGADFPALPSGAVEGVLLLANDNVLQGHVLREGDYYRVVPGNPQNGGELRVPARQAVMFCSSLEEAFDIRRRQLAGRSVADRLSLARWCLRYELRSQAGDLLDEIRAADPDHSGLAPLQRQLDYQVESLTLTRQTSPSPDAPLQSVGQKTTRITEARSSLAQQSAGEFELADGVRADFVRRIQPMLVQSCATTGCHQPSSKRAFQLDRLAMSAGGHPDLIRRNLAAAVGQLDRNAPARSRLVEFARRAHGDPNSRPINPRQARLLIDWAAQVAGVDPNGGKSEPADRPGESDPTGEMELLPSEHDLAPTAWTPRDRFDPEIFNRRRARDLFSSEVEASDRIATPTLQTSPTSPTE